MIARENLLMTFIEYYQAKFNKAPLLKSLLHIAHIISWNLWQMDGLKCVIPDSCGLKPSKQQLLFDEPEMTPCEGCKTGNMHRHNGIYCRIKDWQKNETLTFVSLLKEKNNMSNVRMDTTLLDGLIVGRAEPYICVLNGNCT